MSSFISEDLEVNGKKKSSDLNLLSSFLVVITILIFAFVIIFSRSLYSNYLAVKLSLERFVVCLQSSEQIKSSSNDLTELARMFAVNHDERFAIAYIEEIESTKSQQKALENLKTVCSDKDVALQRLEIAIKQAASLTEMEMYDMRLCYEIIAQDINDIPEQFRKINLRPSDKGLSKTELQNLALKNLFGNGYIIYRNRLNENCLYTIRTISDEVKQELDNNTEKLGNTIDRLRILILALLVVNALSTIGLKEFKNIVHNFDKIYEFDRRKVQTLLKDAEYDALTGILNRRSYDQICAASAEQKSRIALLLIDIDDFKNINDTYGHAGGDTVLKNFASILKDTFRNGDYIARIGGDEFAVILTDFNTEGFKVIIDKIKYINNQLERLEGFKNVSISVGMSYCRTGYSEDLFNQADKALYAVKDAGKKGCRVYDSTLG